MVDKMKSPSRHSEVRGTNRQSPGEPNARFASYGGAPWTLVAILAVFAAWLGWKVYGQQDNGDPVAASLIAFKKQNELTVFSAQLAPVVVAEDSRYLDLLQSRQVAVIPATVRYTLDLTAIEADDMTWNEAAQMLNVTLADIVISPPNLDEGRAQYMREGLWITREAQDELTRANTRRAEQLAVESARDPALMTLARSAAKEAVRQNLAIPLQAAGYGDVSVTVRFADEQGG